MGKVTDRRLGIIEYLRKHGSVERKELWNHFGISKNRLCEDLKALQINGYQFDTTKLGYVSLVEESNTSADVYEPITTPIIRRWILIAWVSMCSELRTGHNSEKNSHMGQKTIYANLCKFYDYIYEKNDPKKYRYLLNTFHRDVREVHHASELHHNLMHVFQNFEEKDLFRLSKKPFLVAFTEELAEKYLFALNELDQTNTDVKNLRDKIKFAYSNTSSDADSQSAYTDFPNSNPEINNVYDRISILASFTSIKKISKNIAFISAHTGLPTEQIKKDLTILNQNNIGRRIFGKNYFRTSAFIKGISSMSNMFGIYARGKNHCILFLPYSEYALFIAIRNLSFIRTDDYTQHSIAVKEYGARWNWYEYVEELWYDK